MSRLRTAKAAPAVNPVPVVRPTSRRADAPRANATVEVFPPGARGGLRQPAAAAWAKLAQPLRRREGIRVGALGITGAGKTTGIADFLGYLQAEQLVDVVLIHDIKGPIKQYDGAVIYEADGLLESPPADPRALVLRRRHVDHTPSVEAAARFTKIASYNGIPTILVIDEFKRALSPTGREFASVSVRELLSEGRALDASLLWTTQLPQRVPTDAYDQSQILIFRCGAKAMSYLIDQRVVDVAAAAVISRLKTGQFVLISSDEDFDGTVYEVPKPQPKGERHEEKEGCSSQARAAAAA